MALTKRKRFRSQKEVLRYGTKKATEKIGISEERLRYWERMGIVNPVYVKHGKRNFREYTKQCIQRAILAKRYVDEWDHTLQGAVRKLKRLNYPVKSRA